MENLEVNIRSFYTLNKEKLENKENIELFNFLGYLNEIVTIICQNFFQQEVKEKTKPFVLAYEKT
ncbi:MAG: hypothetical protein LBU14_02000 [Candidatus Peribacteria bacterium]|jgi:hypothetical protein|nr:hypothetical protein [Candidatus Peribacteria bacterium]